MKNRPIHFFVCIIIALILVSLHGAKADTIFDDQITINPYGVSYLEVEISHTAEFTISFIASEAIDFWVCDPGDVIAYCEGNDIDVYVLETDISNFSGIFTLGIGSYEFAFESWNEYDSITVNATIDLLYLETTETLDEGSSIFTNLFLPFIIIGLVVGIPIFLIVRSHKKRKERENIMTKTPYPSKYSSNYQSNAWQQQYNNEQSYDGLNYGSNNLNERQSISSDQENYGNKYKSKTARFCPNCGVPVEEMTARFCSNCGSRLD